MFIFLLSITTISFILLLIVASMQPTHSELSLFELERRVESGDKEPKAILEREKILNDVISLQHALVALLLASVVLLSVITFDWLIGVVVAVFVSLLYGSIARFGIIQSLGQKLYKRLEKPALRFIQKFSFITSLLRSVSTDEYARKQRIGSRQELQHLVDGAGSVLSADEKRLVIHSLSFGDKCVNTIMTPRDEIISIKKSEFLGPLALDDLHKTGHSRLPVINGDIDHIVGILNLTGLLTLDIKRSMTAEKAMEPNVYYIRSDQTLQHALAAFLRTHHHLFIVVDGSRQTVGILVLEDVIEALIGRKIVDEFDEHDDLLAVSRRKKA